MITQEILDTHFDILAFALGSIRATDKQEQYISLPAAYTRVIRQMRECHLQKKRLVFIGNGGSAAIASHMAIDYTKNGGIRAIAFNDAAALTCLSNDYGYHDVFAEALNLYAEKGDIIIAISSSGKSENILNAVNFAKDLGCMIYTFSGFSEVNPLRKMGDLNFYVATKAGEYGCTEIAHLAILHSILDMICEDKND